MENKPQYQKQLDQIIADIDRNSRPSLLLHACCAPCSSYVLEYLSPYFKISIFYYNPNISSKEEYEKRFSELKRLVKEMGLESDVTILNVDYDNQEFLSRASGMENEPERGNRCTMCYALRLAKTAEKAKELDSDYFCTTLSISPLKDADRINAIGQNLEKRFGVRWLPSDFKKKGGYQRSIELSRQYSLYRQNFCGCIFSRPADCELIG